MILADKIIRLRKKNGWSQEELADRMRVSRQAVSKWEAAQTTPDLEKILMLSKLFGVTTDYLLKDELETEAFTNDEPDISVRRITMEEANTYLEHRKWASIRIALATMLCILSPVCLILMGAASDISMPPFNEDFAAFCVYFLCTECRKCLFSGCFLQKHMTAAKKYSIIIAYPQKEQRKPFHENPDPSHRHPARGAVYTSFDPAVCRGGLCGVCGIVSRTDHRRTR